MPGIKNKSKVTLEYSVMSDYVRKRLKLIANTLSRWNEEELMPAIIEGAPVYSGRDSREKYHPIGLVKKSIKTTTIGFPIVNTRVKVPYIINERAIIATQVLHRGWSRPAMTKGPYLLRLKEGEAIRNPLAHVPAPKGAEGNDWILVPRVGPTTHMTKNPWIVNAYKELWPNLCKKMEFNLENKKTDAKKKKENIQP
jgi:hypothetical protein